MTQYTPLSSIINHVPKYLKDKLGDVGIIALAYDYYTSLNIPQQLVEYCTGVEINNHTIEFTESFKAIKSLHYYTSNPKLKESSDLLNTCVSCKELSITEEERAEILNTYGANELIRKYHSLGCTINYALMLESSYYINNCVKMRYIGAKNGCVKDEYCTDCSDDYLYAYSMDSNSVLRSSICNGYAIIRYLGYPRCNEDYMIIDDIMVKEYLKICIVLDNYENNMDNLQIGIYSTLLRRRDTLNNHIRGKYLLKAANMKNIKEANYGASLGLFASRTVFNKNFSNNGY